MALEDSLELAPGGMSGPRIVGENALGIMVVPENSVVVLALVRSQKTSSLACTPSSISHPWERQKRHHHRVGHAGFRKAGKKSILL